MANLTLSPADLRSVLDFTVSLALKAGDRILAGAEAIRTAEIGTKTNSVDLVTQYDVQVEELVQREIASAYPDFTLCVLLLLSESADGVISK
jgi:myo-inositol-1(or 4)-monophosphatase